ncbi:MAG: hypothetical protein LQ338_007271 [Usnochroma carphineum]|nr:MAG: hypothetical protein LQ338_007271 [Usnochroma carphineum]
MHGQGQREGAVKVMVLTELWHVKISLLVESMNGNFRRAVRLDYLSRFSIAIEPHFIPITIHKLIAPRQLTKPPSQLQRLSQRLRYMAHRIITQAVIVGARVFGRAFAEAYRQASASSKYAQSSVGSGSSASTARNFASSGLTLDEACQILNVKPPQGGQANLEEVMERFKRLFDANDPNKGGSFYLQSKILRARERIEMEARQAQEAAEAEAEVKEGWKPKVWKDR